MSANPLTVKDLKAILADIPDDTLVVLSSDSEGNDFSPLCAYSNGTYLFGRKSWQRGHFFDAGETPPDSRKVREVVALWPLH